MSAQLISAQRRKRGVIRGSLTRLRTKIQELKSARPGDLDTVAACARRISIRLKDLDSEFQTHHIALVELLEGEEDLVKEQKILDQHDNEISDVAESIDYILSDFDTNLRLASELDAKRGLVHRKLLQLQKDLDLTTTAVNRLDVSSGKDKPFLLEQHKEDLATRKRELGNVSQVLILLNLPEHDEELLLVQSSIKDMLFNTPVKIRTVLHQEAEHDHHHGKGVRLPKIDVPRFDGDLLNWKTFWEQYDVSIHSQDDLSDAEKLVYLGQSLSDSKAKHVIDGLARTGECYEEAGSFHIISTTFLG